MITRKYEVEAPDPLAVAKAFSVPVGAVALRLGVTADWTRRLAADAKTAGRVRTAVLELALQRERLQEACR